MAEQDCVEEPRTNGRKRKVKDLDGREERWRRGRVERLEGVGCGGKMEGWKKRLKDERMKEEVEERAEENRGR